MKSIRNWVILLFAVQIGLTGGAAQTGSLHGTIVDQESGEELVGVNVIIVGTTRGANTDLDGKFSIQDLLPGTVDVRVSYVGYASQVITGLVIKEGEGTKLDMSIRQEAYTAEEVTVTAERILSSEAAVLSQRKKAATIGDGISAEQMKRTPDATSGDALKRVTGLSIVDNKFVFIRGVTDRYNGTTLNGVSVGSADVEADKKSFNFDMVPANLLENMVVAKTATPDLPGDLTGGYVQLTTIDFPTQRAVKLSASTSYNSISNLTSLQMSQGGSKDWLGFDDGTRKEPAAGLDRYQIGQQLPNTWAQRTRRAPLSGSLNLSLGDRVEIGEEDLFGYIAALSYRNSFQREEATWNYLTPGTIPISKRGTKDSYSVLWGGIVDMNYKFGGLHKISLQNNFNQSGQDRLTRHRGVDENEQDLKTEVAEWTQRSLYVGNISGEHVIPSAAGITLSWRGAYSESRSKEPDRRESVYARNIYYPEDFPYSTSSGRRLWMSLDDFSRSAAIDLSLPLEAIKVKVGGVYETKDRNYNIRFYVTELDNPNATNQQMYTYGIDSVYRPENYGPNKWYVQTLDSRHDVYQAEQELIAAYAMVDLPFTILSQNFRIAGGARAENSEQLVQTIDPTISEPTPYTVRVKNIDVLPSVNLTYLFNDVTNLRLAYSHSLNRPEFRELTPSFFFSYADFEGRHGNINLKRAYIHNYDARLEVFPAVGEVVAVSYFYKAISNAIEQNLVITSNPERSWFNSPRGKNYGYELEIRKSFSFLRDISLFEEMTPVNDVFNYLSNMAVTGNYTRIFSAIDYVDERTSIPGTREMQGQSPWLINVSLSFREPNIGTGISVLYSEFGRRLDAVGDRRELDVFEENRGVLDLSITQPVWTGLEMKFTVKDLNAKPRRYTFQDGSEYKSLFTGRTYSIQASYTL